MLIILYQIPRRISLHLTVKIIQDFPIIKKTLYTNETRRLKENKIACLVTGQPCDQTKFGSQTVSTEKVKPGFLLSLLHMFPELNGIDQREDPMKMNLDIFQIQKLIPQTVRAQKVDKKMESLV